jgi:hypothetical protein
MPIVLRPARHDDLAPAQELVVRSINALTERHGFVPMASVRPTLFQSFSLRDDPDGLWIAEDEQGLAGSVFSWVSGRFLLLDNSMPGLTLPAENGDVSGYAYVSAGGHIGPVAVNQPA